MEIIAENPLTKLDYPDPDVIRVEDTYYMVSTTMHFMPGCEILRSFDLANWEHAAYVYNVLDSTDAQKLAGDQNIYGKGMWAASLRYHKGFFYLCFVANDTHKTYVYTAGQIDGPWEKHILEGFYHDSSLLFDDDDRIYIAYGNKKIYITELKPDLSGPLEGGLHRLAADDEGNPSLGYEGSHFYKINGRYYLFFIHSQRDRWMRSESCFVADSIDGEFVGKDVLVDDMGYHGQGVAQGGIVDTPDHRWYAVLFQDSGAVGRLPVLVPVTWDGKWPVFGENGKVPRWVAVSSTRPDHVYEPLVGSDDFRVPESIDRERDITGDSGTFGFKSFWQFNHEPDLKFVEHDKEKGAVKITTGKICSEVTQAQNMLTQRMRYPDCEAQVTVDARNLKEGDYAGICALQGLYGFAAVTRRNGRFFVVMTEKKVREENKDQGGDQSGHPGFTVREQECIPCRSLVKLRLRADFADMRDEAVFSFDDGDGFRQIGTVHKLKFLLDHFAGCRFGLFVYSSKEIGGSGKFSDFVYLSK